MEDIVEGTHGRQFVVACAMCVWWERDRGRCKEVKVGRYSLERADRDHSSSRQVMQSGNAINRSIPPHMRNRKTCRERQKERIRYLRKKIRKSAEEKKKRGGILDGDDSVFRCLARLWQIWQFWGPGN